MRIELPLRRARKVPGTFFLLPLLVVERGDRMSMSIEDVVRPAQTPPSAPGYRAPPTRGLNPDPPTTTIEPDGDATDLGDVARTNAINDHQRFPQLRKLLAGDQ
jgi:hypothetical protein